MNLKLFIDRPVMAGVISVVILLGGLIGLTTLPIEQYPDIAPPTVMVVAAYPGASSETMQKSVVAPLEEAINGVENMDYMQSSSANNGSATITIYFRQGTDPDMAAVNVQNKVSQATGSLPAEVTRIGVTVVKRQTSMLKVLAIHSPNGTYDQKFLANYMKLNIEPQIKRIRGVGDMILLSDSYAMRIWFDPGAMAQYGLIPDDIAGVLAEQNIEAATGSFGENSGSTFEYTMKYRGRLMTPEAFGEIIIKALPNGELLRLKEVSHIELGTESYGYISQLDGHPGAQALIFQTAGSNATQVVEEIDAFLEEARKELPQDMRIDTLMSVNDFLYASMQEVVLSLFIAFLLVVLVVYFFLQDFRATLIPSISIIVSLVGTFAFLAIAGFTINLLTLFALVLAIGTVVDNAIVVVEAVQARFDIGYRSSYHATNDAMGGVSAAIITSTLVFMAVFIPVSMMGGTSGIFYTQFGITMAVAVGISAVNALTLSPALCALLMKPYIGADGQEKNGFSDRFRKAFNHSFTAMIDRYKYGVLFFIRRRWLTWTLLLAMFAGLVVLMMNTKKGFVPDEDMGTIMVNVNMPPGSSLQNTDRLMQQIYSRIEDMEQIKLCASVSGYSLLSGEGASNGMLILSLKNWSLRKEKEDEVNALLIEIQQRTADIKDAQVFAFSPPMISGYGVSNGFEMHLQDRNDGDLNEFFSITQQFIGELNQRPEIAMAYSSFNPAYPQYMVDVDAAKCKRAGVSPATVLSTIAGYYGGSYVSNINRFAHVYRVMLQADPQYRIDPSSLERTYVRMDGGQMAPLSEYVTLTKVYGPQTLSRFNMYNSIAVNGSAADGYSSGDAIRAIGEVAANVLPRGYSYEFSGITREESQTSNNSLVVFGICIILIYLILCAFYESIFMPLAIILAVPAGLMGSFLFAKLFGLENNIYLQTGIIMLIGLLAKTAILITDYAITRRKAGMSLTQAAIGAAKVRLRPILMTALTMIFGMLPLMFASGVGANGNSSLGTGAVGGMLIGTLVMLFLVPSLFIIFQWIQEKFRPVEYEKPDWMVGAEIEEVKELKRLKEEK
ncbi:HAE1 family hydrophobic/amphiphilic exporter-1 [Parabacteroides sp. PFB2-12]|uniref:efflux RND transporter permease subunit n=1 Tax=unclassified Parabacteroides TaxID=2649774 RepID=UPI002476EB72|nr:MULTISPECIES: efflux RND transporter permease subunit [unclassified Parabacteroides]MDH6342729.1 HAE1 family hydrophobic/amphiphilic exporter-1 [Parabacteroides sp. PM6-13]MDH6391503.1 HAE1 family hydrophobic/amphiphilic exporter-1 [Parabacteroides sp. PFB2-12]